MQSKINAARLVLLICALAVNTAPAMPAQAESRRGRTRRSAPTGKNLDAYAGMTDIRFANSMP